MLFDAPTIYSDDFDRFWKAYGRVPNASKSDAQKAWTQKSKILPPIDQLIAAVAAYDSWVREETKRQGRVYPKSHPATWLRKELWMDWLPKISMFTKNPEMPLGMPEKWEKLRQDIANDDMFFAWFKGAIAEPGAITMDKAFKANWVRAHFMSKIIYAFGPDVEVKGPKNN